MISASLCGAWPETSIGLVCLSALLLLGQAARAQDKPKAEEQQKKVITPVKVQVTLTEYDGEKKVAVLPYSFLMNSEKGYNTNYSNFLRVGVRVPVAGMDKDGKAQYVDIGSNIDCGVTTEEEGHFSMRLNIERSSLYGAKKDDEKAAISTAETGQPLVPTFRSQSLVVLKDGQTTEVMSAADPLNGHVFRINVTLVVQK